MALDLLSKAHIALDIIDSLNTECQRKIEASEEQLKAFQAKRDSFSEYKTLGDDDVEELEEAHGMIAVNQFEIEFCRKIQDTLMQCYVSTLKDKGF